MPPLDSEKIVKNREKEGKIGEKEKKSGRKGQNREGSFTLPLLTNRLAMLLSNRLIARGVQDQGVGPPMSPLNTEVHF